LDADRDGLKMQGILCFWTVERMACDGTKYGRHGAVYGGIFTVAVAATLNLYPSRKVTEDAMLS